VRYFTPEEANLALEVVRPLTERLVEARREFVGLQGELEEVRRRVSGNGGGLDPGTVGRATEAAESSLAAVDGLLGEITELGVQVKDLDEGLIDFPALNPEDGEVVLLCWRLGEPEVAWWHLPEDGFAGRKPLPFDRTDG
jgi:hypothetical protein